MIRAALKKLLRPFIDARSMASPGRIIVGLGNPGQEYAGSRHNIGFEIIDRIIEITRSELDTDRDNAISGTGRYQGRPFTASKPMLYMNRSGQVVRKLLNRNRPEVDSLLVIVDDLNLPFGSVRFRSGGGAGGHNGLQDIIDSLGTGKFARLRVGVGSDFGRGQQVEHVLSSFDAAETEQLEGIIQHSAKGALTFVSRGINEAMNRYNLTPERE